jgi:hypothetical protein
MKNSDKKYFAYWHRLIKKIEKITEMQCTAYDPDIVLDKIEDKRFIPGMHVCLPVWLVKMIIKKVEKK